MMEMWFVVLCFVFFWLGWLHGWDIWPNMNRPNLPKGVRVFVVVVVVLAGRCPARDHIQEPKSSHMLTRALPHAVLSYPFKVMYSSQPPIWVLLWLWTLFLLCSLHILKWRLLLPGAQREWKSTCICRDRTWASIPSSRTHCKTSLEKSCRIKSKTLLLYEEVCVWQTSPVAQHSVVSGWADYLPFSGKCLTSTDCRLSMLNAFSSKSTHHTVLDLSWSLAHEKAPARLNTEDLLLG